jgi:hypothetical protein
VWIPPRKLNQDDRNFYWQTDPPRFFAPNVFGIPVFRRPIYDELRVRLSWFPNPDSLQPIRSCEALLLVQGEAPMGVLGRAPRAPWLQRERVVAVAEGDLNEELDTIDASCREFATCETPMRPVDGNAFQRSIELFLDAPRFPVWRGFCHLSTGLGLMLEPWRPLQMILDGAPSGLDG